jgi:O-antigen ligase
MLSSRLVAFFLIFTLTNQYFSSYNKINNFLIPFIVGALLNAIPVIFLAVTTGRRVFGFAGIMYVDLVNIAIIICLIGFLYKNKKFISGVALLVLITALIFTQTRGSWIVCGLTMIGILVHSFFNFEKSTVGKSKIILTVIFVIVALIIVVYLFMEINPEAYKRVDVSQTERPISETGISSLATRVFIWKTSLNAFISNPLTGIGIYAFPFASKTYSDIDPYLYKLFVETLTPHTTILALLAEVGLFGFFGFIFFLYKTISLAKQNLKQAILNEQWYYSNVLYWISIYIALSMIVTDAWLWGTLMMLWGIILSISIANQRLLLLGKSRRINIAK